MTKRVTMQAQSLLGWPIGTRLEFLQERLHPVKPPEGWRRVGTTKEGIICEKE